MTKEDGLHTVEQDWQGHDYAYPLLPSLQTKAQVWNCCVRSNKMHFVQLERIVEQAHVEQELQAQVQS